MTIWRDRGHFGPHRPLRVVRCVQTCAARPSQWECESADGATVYLRYRDDGSVGVGPDLEAAVVNTIHEFEEGGWSVTLEEFAARLPDWITIEGPALAEWPEDRARWQ